MRPPAADLAQSTGSACILRLSSALVLDFASADSPVELSATESTFADAPIGSPFDIRGRPHLAAVIDFVSVLFAGPPSIGELPSVRLGAVIRTRSRRTRAAESARSLAPSLTLH
jgi:hypothetical protein